MLIALEGMDGVGKSSLSRLCARLLGGSPVVKAVHPLCHPERTIDNFLNVSDLVLSSQSELLSRCQFGVRGIFIYYRLNDVPMVADRFYASNLWHVERRDADIQRLVDLVGVPEKTILLYASESILRKRIEGRDAHDKDLEKIDLAESAYSLMRDRFAKLAIPFVELSTEALSLDEIAKTITRLYGREKPHHVRGRYRAFSFAPSDVRRKVVPKTVETIDAKAFFYLRHLSSFSVHGQNRRFKSIRGVLHSRDGMTLECYPSARGKRSYSVGDRVKAIAPSAFLNEEKLEAIALPERLLEIGSTAFFNCRSLIRIHIPASVGRIGPMNFLGCVRLVDISVDSGNETYSSDDGILYESSGDVILKYPQAKLSNAILIDCRVVRAWAFAEVVSLKYVELGNRIESIEAYAFMNSKIKEVVVSGARFGHIGERAFAFCRHLEKVKVYDASPNLDVNPLAFEGCEDGLRVYLPQSAFARIWKNPRKRDLWRRIRSVIAEKDIDESCGTAVLKYILRSYVPGRADLLVNSGIFWIFDIASFLVRQFGPDTITLSYHKSRLIEDFNAGVLGKDFSGRESIEKYIALRGTLKGATAVCKTVESIAADSALLMLVDNSILHGHNDGGGHYIVVKEVREDYALIVNPQQSVCVEELVLTDVLVSSCEAIGGWTLLVHTCHLNG